ncbi:choice-of-anchor Q domain-containing protein [Ferruginibacter sp. SUN106]|uniref:choice-of-anchor Q domain-containing protein n=1 Tax=Ferruginibacter sp. SUN106 TaxID=2978348 RepID=UPI003D361154
MIAIFFCLQLKAQQHSWVIDSAVNLLDGTSAAYNKVHPGDTIYLKPGNRNKLLIRNFKGTADSAIIFMNANGIVTLSTNDYYGISISNCRYIRFSGNGNSNNFYGIQIKKVAAGAGVGIGAMSSDVEIDHVSIENCSTEGIFAKTDPDCTLQSFRDNFTQFNTNLHDNYIANTGTEGMYIGSSFYSGMKITCNGKDTIVMPPVLDGVKIYNNIVTNTGWDGIQVSSAPLHCYIFDNKVSNDSQSETPNQMSGIIMGGGSKCDCNNNLITNGKGDGIENHGLGGNRIFNNIIVNAGRTYLPNDATQMKHGILVSDVSVVNDSAVCIFFNDIINPKSDGIRFQSVKSKHNLIASNCIVNPGNYNLYELDNTSFTGNDAYVMIPNAIADIQLKNNYFSRTIAEAGISPTDYSILPGSPLINQGYPANGAITFDFNNHRRPVGGLYDIGAIEYSGGVDTMLHTFSDKPLLFPNPVNSTLTIKYLSIAITKTILHVYALSGAQVMEKYSQVITPGIQELHVGVDHLPGGVYVYAIQNGMNITYGKFIKF